ncbi:hypothetical protein [Natronomonas marina]|nr:hypothetical protein [Natronomonas marina]
MTLDDCPTCGGSLAFVERRSTVTANGHHNCVYECGECGCEVISG